jgi:hypothetical protein
MKKPRNAVAEAEQPDRPLSMKERAKKARHDAYERAKEWKKNDPRTIQLKEKLKQGRREANAQAKERRKNRPKQAAAAVRKARDVTLLINYAGALNSFNVLTRSPADLDADFRVQVHGTLGVIRRSYRCSSLPPQARRS